MLKIGVYANNNNYNLNIKISSIETEIYQIIETFKKIEVPN